MIVECLTVLGEQIHSGYFLWCQNSNRSAWYWHYYIFLVLDTLHLFIGEFGVLILGWSGRPKSHQQSPVLLITLLRCLSKFIFTSFCSLLKFAIAILGQISFMFISLVRINFTVAQFYWCSVFLLSSKHQFVIISHYFIYFFQICNTSWSCHMAGSSIIGVFS